MYVLLFDICNDVFWLFVKAGMGNPETEWGERWERGKSGWERGKSRWEWRSKCWEYGECGESRWEYGEWGWECGKWGWECGESGWDAGNQGGNAENQGKNAGNQSDSLWESSWLLLRLNSRSARGAFHHPALIGSCPTISHMYFALPTKWMSSPSRKWGRGVSPRFHILVFVFGVNQEN